MSADTAEAWSKQGKKVVLVRNETSPEDVHGMHVAQAILTAKGGMTSHAALVARGWGKCCIVGCGALNINYKDKTVSAGSTKLKEGDWISLNGTAGKVYVGQVGVLPAQPDKNKWYNKLMTWADQVRQINVRTNAERPEDAQQAIKFGAEGIGLARTEHMFFEPERIVHMREMILAENEEVRRKAVMKLLPYQKKDFIGILKVMAGKPVTIRLLDPPLHEFVTLTDNQIDELSKQIKVPAQKIKERIHQLHELNPMLGHRGCRLGVAYPEITEMQARAILEAAAELTKKKVKVFPEIMIPLVGHENEFKNQEAIVRNVAEQVQKEYKIKLSYLVGTMIEIPRACLIADKIAENSRVLQLRHERPDPDGLRVFARRRRRVPALLPRRRHSAPGSVPGLGPGRHRPVGRHGRRARPVGPPDLEGRYLRRARRRTQFGEVLPPGRSELRELQPVPRTHRAFLCRAGRDRNAA